VRSSATDASSFSKTDRLAGGAGFLMGLSSFEADDKCKIMIGHFSVGADSIRPFWIYGIGRMLSAPTKRH
jgi:hypothetical protein